MAACHEFRRDGERAGVSRVARPAARRRPDLPRRARAARWMRLGVVEGLPPPDASPRLRARPLPRGRRRSGPCFTPLASPTQKILGDNVDSLYHFAPLRGDRALSHPRPARQRGVPRVLRLRRQARRRVVGARRREPLAARHRLRRRRAASRSCSRRRRRRRRRATWVDARARRRLRDHAPVLHRPRRRAAGALHDRGARARRRRRRRSTTPRSRAACAPSRPSSARRSSSRRCRRCLPPNLLGPPMPWSPHVPGWGTPDNVYSLGALPPRARRGARHRGPLAALHLLGRRSSGTATCSRSTTATTASR